MQKLVLAATAVFISGCTMPGFSGFNGGSAGGSYGVQNNGAQNGVYGAQHAHRCAPGQATVVRQGPVGCKPVAAPVVHQARSAVKCPPAGVAVNQVALPAGCRPTPARTYSVAKSAPATYVSGGPQQGYASAPGYGSQAQAAGHPAGSPPLRGFYQPYDSHFYGGIGGVWYDTDLDAAGIVGRVGYQTGNFFGAEVEGSLGVKSDKSDIGNTFVVDEDGNLIGSFPAEAKFKVNNTIGAYAVGRVPLTPSVSIFGRGGYVFADAKQSVELTPEVPGVTIPSNSSNVDGLSYGGGVEYKWDPLNGVRADYIRTEFGSGVGTFDSVAVSYVRRF